jgi:hypothetical protein
MNGRRDMHIRRKGRSGEGCGRDERERGRGGAARTKQIDQQIS